MNNTIGIVIAGKVHTFANGLNQNAIFLYILCKQLGFTCELLSYDKTQTQIVYENIPVTYLSPKLDTSVYKAILTLGLSLDKSIYENCKRTKTAVIGYICSNQLCIAIEGVATDHTKSYIVGRESAIDKAWILDSFPFMKTYIELMRDVKAQFVPHVWSPSILEYYCKHMDKKDPALLVYNPAIHTQKKMSLIITDPNLNFVKTAVVPLLAAEKLYTIKPELIDEIFVFSYPTESKSMNDLVENLKVGKKVRKFQRKIISEIMLHFNTLDTVPVFVSNQIYTPLNYSYYETMYYGYPFVHNSPLLKEYGYYYTDLDIDLAAVQIMKAYTSHAADFDARLAKNRAFLETIDPTHMKCVLRWKGMFDDI